MVTKNNPIHIVFIGRLEPEKGSEVLLDFIKYLRSNILFSKDIRLSICGMGSTQKEIAEISEPRERSSFKKEDFSRYGIFYYGQRSVADLEILRSKSNVAFMPSLFLETFGLAALEAIFASLPVIGFKKGGLEPFIPSLLAIDEDKPTESLIRILSRILIGEISLSSLISEIDITKYSYPTWQKNLSFIIDPSIRKILLVNDYAYPMGGAESYIEFLKNELEKMGKEVKIFTSHGKFSLVKKRVTLFLLPFSFWRNRDLSKTIDDFGPDLVWVHNALRYIGPFGLRAIWESGIKTYVTHHDLGLLTFQPSNIYGEDKIPKDTTLGKFIRSVKGTPIYYIPVVVWKWFYIRWMWKYLERVKRHMVPSEFMVKHLENHGVVREKIQVFPHTKL